MRNFIIFFSILILFACSVAEEQQNTLPPKESQITQISEPEWIKDAVLYELNIRQFSKEGTFEAVKPQLLRLKEMGIDIIWFMPIHPIGKEKRKGSLGSYYSIDDYRAINEEYGNHTDFKSLVDSIHSLGMYAILDWVPHHTSWNHPWISENPEYYNKNEKGEIRDPINEETGKSWEWFDVAELNLYNDDMRENQMEDMKYWVEEFDVDGFRIDHAHRVHLEFWTDLIGKLNATGKPLYFLAEGDNPWLRNRAGFHSTYAWKFGHAMTEIAHEKKNAKFIEYLLWFDNNAFAEGHHVFFTSNHDINAWEGTVFERLEDGHKTFAVMCATIDGMPLLYSGQEAPLQKRLEFFDKDAIDWNDYEYEEFYQTLFTLKDRNKAMWNGIYGGKPQVLNPHHNDVLAYYREKDESRLLVILNLSKKSVEARLDEKYITGKYVDVFSGKTTIVSAGQSVSLGPWAYLVYSNK